MSRSCHSVTFSSAGMTALRTTRARPVRFSVSTGLRLCGIEELPFWPSEKNSSASRTSVRCRWRISVARFSMRRGDDAEGGEERGVPVARDDLGRHRLDGEAELLGDMLFDPRIDVGEGADRAGDGAGRDLGPRRHQPRAVAREGGVVAGELHAEGRGLGMDAVAAADGERVLVLQRALLQRRQQLVDVAEQDVGGLGELDGEAGVEHVRRGHALVHEARLRADELAEPGQEGDHVVLGDLLDGVDLRDLAGRDRP